MYIAYIVKFDFIIYSKVTTISETSSIKAGSV